MTQLANLWHHPNLRAHLQAFNWLSWSTPPGLSRFVVVPFRQLIDSLQMSLASQAHVHMCEFGLPGPAIAVQ
jgi:hypothetical protein